MLATTVLAACGPAGGTEGGGEPQGGVSQAIGSGSSNWVDETGGGLPWDAVVAGIDNDGTPLYACRASLGAGTQLGKIRAGWPGCDIPYGGAEVSVHAYQVLAPLWIAASSGSIPAGAVVAGFEANGAPLYFCRDHFNTNDLQPGKIRQGFPGCKIGYAGNEYDRVNYEVLVSRWAVSWQESTGHTLPQSNPFVLLGGHEQDGRPLYLCRAEYQGLQPGKDRTDFQSCKFTYAGTEHDQSNWLGTLHWDSVSADWEGAINGAIPSAAVAQGTDNDGAPLFACRAYYGGGLHPGKIRKDWPGCDIPYGGREVNVSSYAVLVEP
jgi:hypothetical protein